MPSLVQRDLQAIQAFADGAPAMGYSAPRTHVSFAAFIAEISGRQQAKGGVLAPFCWVSNLSPSAGSLSSVTQLSWGPAPLSGQILLPVSWACGENPVSWNIQRVSKSIWYLVGAPELLSLHKSVTHLPIFAFYFFELNWKESNNARLRFLSLGGNVISPYGFAALPVLCRNPGK